jgi:ABC-type glycerol-3-phosphate transport system substrate-binding protein
MQRKPISFLIITVFISSIILFPGCLRKKGEGVSTKPSEPVTLTFYGLFDKESAYDDMIRSFEDNHPNFFIEYKKFTDPEAYLDLIINELAEGEGPDLFMMHNSWFPRHYKKLTAAPEGSVTPELFRSLFVDVAAKDMIIPNELGKENVWGMPLYIDTLALFYNDEHIEDTIPERGRPGDTWEEIVQDVIALNRSDNSFSRFERSGLALGRHDNILRAFDILMMMFLQHKVDFYNDDLTKTLLGGSKNATAALNLFTSFALPSKQNYSWNEFLSEKDSAEKEIEAFARGKVSMIFGYSYAYNDIRNQIEILRLESEDKIDIQDVKVQEAPQVFDTDATGETREAYASYFAPVVSRTSEYPKEAWDFLISMANEDDLRAYNEETNRPSALRSLINEQTADPIYGPFAAQVGYAKSIPMTDAEEYEDLFTAGISNILNRSGNSEDILRSIANTIDDLIPLTGIKPTYVSTDSE